MHKLSMYFLFYFRDQVLEDVFKAWTENIQSLSEELMAPGEDDDLRNELNNSVSNLASLSHLLMSNALSKQPGIYLLF